MTYKEQLLDPRWQKKRLEILERDDFRCQLCYDPFTTLHIHHINYRKIMAWEYGEHELITYCKHCHALIEYYKKIKDDSNHVYVIKRDMDNEVSNMFCINMSKYDCSKTVDIFNYSYESIRYLATVDMFTIHTLYQTVSAGRQKEEING